MHYLGLHFPVLEGHAEAQHDLQAQLQMLPAFERGHESRLEGPHHLLAAECHYVHQQPRKAPYVAQVHEGLEQGRAQLFEVFIRNHDFALGEGQGLIAHEGPQHVFELREGGLDQVGHEFGGVGDLQQHNDVAWRFAEL